MLALKQGSVPDVIANKLDHLLILTSGTEQYLITCTNKKYKFLLTTTLTISGFKILRLLELSNDVMAIPSSLFESSCIRVHNGSASSAGDAGMICS